MVNTILITGGAGFVGSSIALFLKNDFPTSKIIVLDNLKRRGSELNLNRLKSAGVVFIHGDIRNPEDIEQVGHFDLLIDCAAEPSVIAGYDSSPSYVIRTNLEGTINCLEFVRKMKADVIFLSTSRVYPIQKIGMVNYTEEDTRFSISTNQTLKGVSSSGISEEFSLEGSRSMYGVTKLASELLISEYEAMYGIRAIINRCGVLTGPWQMGKVDQGFVVLWAAKHVYGGDLSYIGFEGKGKQIRDILHVQDLYRLLKKQYDRIDELSGGIFNVGGGVINSISLLEMTKICSEVTGNTIKINSIHENRNADIPLYISDCTKVKQATGWEPEVTPKQIVEEVVVWLQNYESQLKQIMN